MHHLSTKYNDTPDKASRTYDADRDGFVISGGGGLIPKPNQSKNSASRLISLASLYQRLKKKHLLQLSPFCLNNQRQTYIRLNNRAHR